MSMTTLAQTTITEAQNCILRARELSEEWEKKDAAPPADVQTQIDALLDEAETKTAAAKRLADTETRRTSVSATLTALAGQPVAGAELPPPRGTAAPAPDATPEYKAGRAAFTKALFQGPRSLTAGEEVALKALSAVSDPDGGYLVAPQDFITQLITIVDDMVFIRKLATVIPMARAESLGVPVLDNNLNDADWTSELATGTQDDTSLFSKRELKPSALAKRVLMSKKLIRQAAIPPERILMDRMAYKFGITEEKAFLTGSGSNQPLGVFTASDDGIPTGQDTAAGSATVIAADDLINVKHDLKLQYWAKAQWIINRSTLKLIRKLKDSNQNYVWATGLGPGQGFAGNPMLLLELPYNVSEYAPGTISSGNYSVILGDFSHYWVAEALQFQVQVLTELYAATNQNGYIGRAEIDGMPTLSEAFRRLKH